MKVAPVRVTYETLVEHPGSAILRIATSLGVDLTHCARVALPGLRRQADDDSEDWLRNLIPDARARSP